MEMYVHTTALDSSLNFILPGLSPGPTRMSLSLSPFKVVCSHLPGPDPKLWVVPVSRIIGRLPLVPAGNHRTIPHDMQASKQACFEYGTCDVPDGPGTGSPPAALFYINSWEVIWPSDHPVLNA